MICPVRNFLLIKPDEKITREKITTSGIVLTDVKDDRIELAVTKGEVFDVGSDVQQIKKGQVVYYNFFAGNQVVVPGSDPLGKDDIVYHLIIENDILAVEKE